MWLLQTDDWKVLASGYSTFGAYGRYQIEGQLLLVISVELTLRSWWNRSPRLKQFDMTFVPSRPFLSACQMGCQQELWCRGRSVKKRCMTWIDGMFATLSKLQTRKVNWDGRPTCWSGALPHLNGVRPVSHVVTTWSACWYYDKYGHLPNVEWHVLQTHVSRWPAWPWWEIPEETVFHSRPSQRSCNLAYWDYYEEKTIVISAITTRIAKI